MNDDSGNQGALFPQSVGERLRQAREEQGLDLADIANRTRVPIRHLQAIEEGRFDAMPSPTYAIGFARSYARAVGLDEREVANAVRQSPQLPVANATDYEAYEPSDPKRLPSRGLAMAAAIAALVVLIGVAIYYGTTLLRGSDAAPVAAPTDAATVAAAPEVTPTPAAGGQVTLVATDRVWLRVYDAAGKTLIERELAGGDRYDVPADAANPMINVGRPDKLDVTLNGSRVAPLGDGSHAIKDVPISAAALLARGASPTPTGAASSTPDDTSRPRATHRARPRSTPNDAVAGAPDTPPVAAATPPP